MGLATLLKRKLGKDAPNGAQKRSKTSNLPRPTVSEVAALKAKGTRTARRKLKKLGSLADDPLPDDPLLDGNDDDDDVDGDINLSALEPSNAYDALLSSLATTSETLAAQVELRRRELAGDSDNSEDEEEEDSEVDSEDEEESEHESEESDKEELLENGNGAHGDKNNLLIEDEAKEKESSLDEDEFEDAQEGDTRDISTKAESHGVLRDDHFESHFGAQLTEEELGKLAAASTSLGTPYVDLDQAQMNIPKDHLQAWLPNAKVQGSLGATLPSSIPSQLREYGVKERLVSLWRDVHGAGAFEKKESDFVSSHQRAFFALLSSYVDILHPNRPYPTPSSLAEAPDSELDAVLLHVINHVATTSDRIKKNNEKLSHGNTDPDDVPRDQGFTRPKVLFLLPMRNTAFKLVSRLLALALRETRTDSIQNKQRFLEEFGAGDDEEGEEAGLSAREKAALQRKPAEHRGLFAGNLDDHFRLGIKLTRGAARLYSDFYQSDVLVLSPLALATKLSDSEKEGAGAADFLSSIEILVMERADVMQMQNWAHVNTVMAALNKMPAQQRDVDIMRVREWYLAGQARYYRQTIVLSSFASPEINALTVKGCSNHSGRVRLTPEYKGVLGQIVPQIRQVFERLALPVGSGPAGEPDARFEHFKSVLWPRIRETARGGGQLIYIPSYYDFVRVRNFLRAEAASFLGLCEYTERADMARARSYFADGRRRVLLYTERAQFYNRHRIRGVKDIVFYQLPEHPQFYEELVNFLEEENVPGAGLATATVMYTRYDALRLERVVGSDRSKTMLKKKNGTFLFC